MRYSESAPVLYVGSYYYGYSVRYLYSGVICDS